MDKKYNYSKNKHCKCGKLICNNSLNCLNCTKKELMRNPLNNPKYIDGRSLNNKCLDCGKNIKRQTIRCNKCENKHHSKVMKAKNNNHKPSCLTCGKRINYNSKYCKKCFIKLHTYYCIDCKIKLSTKNAKRCWKCYVKFSQIPENNPAFGRINLTGKTIIQHHIDLNPKNNIKRNKLKLTQSVHMKLHQRAYKFLVKTGQIDNYLKWFFKNLEIK